MALPRDLLHLIVCSFALGLGPAVSGEKHGPLGPFRTIQCGEPTKDSQCCANKTGQCYPTYSTPDMTTYCCCPTLLEGRAKNCQLDPYRGDGKCALYCCADRYKPCGDGCCGDLDEHCGFWTNSSQRDHTVPYDRSKVECCVKKSESLTSQCSAFGSGTDCRRPNETRPCALKCQPSSVQIAEPYIWCNSGNFDRHYWCQDDCSKWQGERLSWLQAYPALAILIFVVGVGCVLVLGRRCARFGCRRWRPEVRIVVANEEILDRGLHGSLISTDSRSSGLTRSTAVVPAQELRAECFVLIIGVPKYRDSLLYRPLHRIGGDRGHIMQVKEVLLKVQPSLSNAQIVIEPSCLSEQDIWRAVETFCVKIGGSNNALLFLFIMGHGCRRNGKDQLVAWNGAKVDVSSVLDTILQSRNRSNEHEFAGRPNLIGIIDICRTAAQGASVNDEAPPEDPEPRFVDWGSTDGNPYLIWSTHQQYASNDGHLTERVLTVLRESDEPMSGEQFVERVKRGRPDFLSENPGSSGGRPWSEVIINPRIYQPLAPERN